MNESQKYFANKRVYFIRFHENLGQATLIYSNRKPGQWLPEVKDGEDLPQRSREFGGS